MWASPWRLVDLLDLGHILKENRPFLSQKPSITSISSVGGGIMSGLELLRVMWMLSHLPWVHMCDCPAMCRDHCLLVVSCSLPLAISPSALPQWSPSLGREVLIWMSHCWALCNLLLSAGRPVVDLYVTCHLLQDEAFLRRIERALIYGHSNTSIGVIFVAESILNDLSWVVSISRNCWLIVSVQLICLHILLWGKLNQSQNGV